MSEKASGPMVSIDGLSKSFGPVQALDSLDLEVAHGEVLGLLGPNGAGKTTTIRMLLGLEMPTRGSVRVAGTVPGPANRDLKRTIGWVPQATASDPLLTGREQLTMMAELYGVDDPSGRVRQALDTFGLTEAANRRISSYSGGMQKRLELAAGTLHDPELLILDEPTAGLDVSTRHQIWDLVRSLNAAGTTVLITTHYLDEADILCDRVAIIDRGRLCAVGSPAELRRQHGEPEIVMRWSDEAVAGQAQAVLREEQAAFATGSVSVRGAGQVEVLNRVMEMLGQSEVPLPDEIETVSPTLDQVFAQVTGRDFDPVTGTPMTDDVEQELRSSVAGVHARDTGNAAVTAEVPGEAERTHASGSLRSASATLLANNLTFLKRWAWRLRRDRFTLGLALLQPALWLILFGNLWEGVISDEWTGDGYLQFITAGAVMMTVFNFGLMAGLEVVVDRERGALDRLIAAPVYPLSLVTSRVLFVGAIGSLQTIVIVVVATIMGVSFESGIVGVSGLLLLAALLGAGVAATSVLLGFLVVNHGQFYTVTGLAALPLILVSTVFAPLDVMPDWLAALARINPMSYAVDGARSMVVDSSAASDFALNAGVLGGFVAIVLLSGAIAGKRYLAVRR